MFQFFADFLIYRIFNFSETNVWGVALNFFLADLLKIYFLTFFIIGLIAFLRTFFPPASLKKIMAKSRFGFANFLAAILGAFTPFCSCSGIPLFLGLLSARLPLGVALSFLITSPILNEIVFVMLAGFFGWKIAIFYALTCIFLGVSLGVILGKMKLEKELLLDFENLKNENKKEKYLPKKLNEKIQFALRQSIKTFKKLWWILAIGVAMGATFHGFLPEDFLTKYLNLQSFWAVPLAVILGVPIYVGCASAVPVVFAFVLQGVPLGTALAFLLAAAGLSLPEALILKRIFSWKLLLIFFGSVSIGIILIGYLFNFLTKI